MCALPDFEPCDWSVWLGQTETQTVVFVELPPQLKNHVQCSYCLRHVLFLIDCQNNAPVVYCFELCTISLTNIGWCQIALG